MSLPVHISLKLAEDVFNICKPFFKRYKLNAFSYARIYPDGTRTELWSDALALEHTFFKKKYIVGAYTPNYFSEGERFSYLPLKVNEYPKNWKEKYTQQLTDQREYFNHDHAFIMVNRELGFCEYFIYYAPVNASSTLNFYINNLNILDSFADNFKENAADLIKIADSHRILSLSSSINDKNDSYLSKDIRFTSREIEVANLLLNGRVAREVGDILEISRRTVESHIVNIKSKTNCRNKSELISFLHSECGSLLPKILAGL